MPESEEPRRDRDPEPDAESPAAALALVVEMVRHHAENINSPAGGIDGENEREHRDQSAPLPTGQVACDPAKARSRQAGPLLRAALSLLPGSSSWFRRMKLARRHRPCGVPRTALHPRTAVRRHAR